MARQREGPALSIVLPAHNEGDRLRDTVRAIRTIADIPYEIVVVDDASQDGCAAGLGEGEFSGVIVHRSPHHLGVAGARNVGARRTRASMIMFMDAHCIPAPGFLRAMTAALAQLGRGIVVPCVSVLGDPSACGFGMTLEGPSLAPVWYQAPACAAPHTVPVGPGCAQLFYRVWFEQIGGYDRMRRYGVEDLEISMRSWLLGGPVQVVPGASLAHYFRQQTTCAVTWTDVVYNMLRFAYLHFDGRRLEAIIAHWAAHPSYEEAKALLGESDVAERRSRLDRHRRRSADWYCDRFAIPI